MDKTLQIIRDFADNAHGTQLRKYSPDRYIVHPVRVMETCSKYTTDKSMLAAALLHDVLEDTATDKAVLKTFLDSIFNAHDADRALTVVTELTDVYIKATYPQWNRRKRKNEEMVRMQRISPAAQTIKYADIIDNCKEIVEHDPDFAGVFLKECRALLKKINKGDATLYREAVLLVDNCITVLDDRDRAENTDTHLPGKE